MKVAVCCIIKLENLYIEEFILHYQSIGVDHIFIYDNNDPNDEDPNDVCKKYVDDGFVSIINYRDQGKYPMGQGLISAFNNCWVTNRNDYDWILFCDNDEFLNFDPIYKNNIKNYLSDECFNNVDIIKINWRCFDDNNLIYYEDKPLKERFTHLCWDDPYCFDENRHVKSLCNCHSSKKFIWDETSAAHSPNTFLDDSLVISDNTGKILKKQEDYVFTQQINYINYDKAWLDHYRMKTIDEYVNNKIKKLTKKGYSLLGFTSNMFFNYNEYSKEKETIYLDYIKDHSKNCIYTIVFDDEPLIELENKIDGWDYICFTTNKKLTSNTWAITYVNKIYKWQIYGNYLLMINKYLKTYDFSLYVRNDLLINFDMNYIKKNFIDVLNSYDTLIYSNQSLYNNDIQIIGRYHKDQQLIISSMKCRKKIGRLLENVKNISINDINDIICEHIKENIKYKIIDFPIILSPDQKYKIYKKTYLRSWRNNLIDIINLEDKSKLINWAEKIIYLNIKTNYLDSKYIYCNKLKAKEFIEEFKKENNIIDLKVNPVLGIYDDAFDIYEDLNSLPNKFMIKCNHDSGSYKVINNKNDFNDDLCITFNHLLNKIYGITQGETQYININRKLFIEPLIEPDNKFDSYIDYNFFCFNGTVKYCLVKYDHQKANIDIHRLNNTVDTANLYDANWTCLNDKYLNNTYKYRIDNNYGGFKNMQMPNNYYTMIYICSKLSEKFNFVRIDLMSNGNDIYFLELTFTPMGLNYYHYFNKEFNDELGKYINI